MPEHPNGEHELDAIITRVVDDAGADAPAPPPLDRFTAAVPITYASPSPRRWLPVLAAAIVVGGLVAGVVLAARRGDGSTSRPGVSTESGPPEVTAASLPSTSSTVGATLPIPSISTVPSTPSMSVGGLTRPIVDPSTCTPLYARDGVAAGVSLFARPSSRPIAMQVIADPARGAAGPFALVQRYFGDERTPGGQEPVELGGITFWIGVYDNGNGQVEWDVGGGSQGYLRSRGLDREQLLGIVSALSPRPADTPVPGFDYAPPTLEPMLQLLHEQMNTDVSGEVHRSACQHVMSGLQYRVSTITGDPVLQFGGVIDRPVPLDVGVVDGTVVVIDGPSDPNQPTIADVIDAAAADWTELTTRPEHAPESVAPPD
jgi:hypothetical protein